MLPKSIHLNDLVCKSIHAVLDLKRVPLRGCAEGLELCRAESVLYIPEWGLQIANGIVPHEAILYEMHLDLALRQIPIEKSYLELDCVERSTDEVCILGNTHANNFGHWTEELLKVVMLENNGFDGKYVVANWHPAFCHDSLNLMGISESRILKPAKPVVYDTAVLTSLVSHFWATKYPGVLLRLRDELHSASERDSGFGERIWVERGHHARSGTIVNSEEVYSFIKKHGFTPVDFSCLPFRKQIAVDREMNIMLGPHGSAFVHCQFMYNRKKVIEIFSPEYINPSIIQLCQVLQHRYNQIVPTHQPHWRYLHGQDILVDISHLELVLSY